MTINYTTGIPTSQQSLGITQQPIQNNFSVINTAFGKDHSPFNSTNQGYHTVIHQIPQGNPAAIMGINQIYSKITSGTKPGANDTQLFTITGGGGISQLTGSAGTNPGGVYVGGLLMQWGTQAVSNSGTLTTINMLYTFTGNALSVIITPYQSTNVGDPSENNVYIVPGSIGTNSFNVSNSSSGTLNKINWLAIGIG